GICEEANLMRAHAEPKTLSGAYRLMVDAEPRLAEIPNQRVIAVEKDGDRIAAAVARDTLTGRRTRTRGTIFIDCTGDGWVGIFAGAAHMYGREAQCEYDEWPAPEKRDNLTMSGCLMDGYLGYRFARRGYPVPYATPPWADVLPPGFTRRIRSISPTWWIEHGGRFDDLDDPERARDELVRIVFAYWGWVKNVWEGRAEAANAELTQVPFMNARREGYRLAGDYVLTANDALEGKMFPDRIAYGGWPLDTHDPLGMENPDGNGYWKHHPGVPTYTIPYRCLYSKNISNLMFAGRCQSVTHIALGSVRVEATLFTLGQAAGSAAALAVQKGLSPREYGRRHVADLQQRLLKDDQYIPGLKNEDPLDLARTAKVSATSVKTCDLFGKDDPNLRPGQDARPERTVHDLARHDRATWFARETLGRLEAVECLMYSEADAPTPLAMRVWATDCPTNGTAGGELLGTWHGTAPARRRSFVRFAGDGPVPLTKRYVWLEIGKTKGVSWIVRNRAIGPDDGRAWRAGQEWVPVRGEQYAFVATPHVRRPFDARAEYVVDGVSRQEGACVHGWVSDPAQPLPQSLRLDFPKPVTACEVRLTFDTDLTPPRVALNPYPRTLAKAYRVEGFDGTGWHALAEEGDNGLRLRVHRFEARRLAAVRVTVTETWGDRSARIFEVRVY
ncbi:MAG: FAD-dependent oxidoreductase, partial [Kiritimatiellae bacterium]|nr:FAD-dependent oxidoreductase [Kiritimatiellia bacterium]